MRAYLCFPFDLNNGVHGLGKLELTNAGVVMHQVGRNGRHRLVTLAMQACSWRETERSFSLGSRSTKSDTHTDTRSHKQREREALNRQ
jgi:hypothetical protein